MPIATILQNPTVSALATCIAPGSGLTTREYDPIVPLPRSGRKPPLFCIHPAVGEVLVYVNLAKYFVNDRPFYAIRARGLNAGDDYFQTLDEVVQTYVAAIRKRQPHGPYAIAGYSFGGIAGFEVAKALEARGEKVGFFCSIDMPPYVTEPITPDYCAISLAYFLSLIDKDKMLELINHYRGKDPDLCEYLVKHAPATRLAELDLDLSKFEPWAALTYSLGRIAKSYEPSGSLERATVLFTRPQAGTKHDWLKGWVDVQIKRWDAHSRLPTRYVEVTGEHASLMDTQHVANFQAILRAEVDRALDGN
jgi:thioesterase domain-containing protein